MNAKPPLKIYLLAHQRSSQANELAKALMKRFVDPPLSGGLRIPVFFTPDKGDNMPPSFEGVDAYINLDSAQHSILVIFVDSRMLRKVDNGTGKEWVEFIRRLLQLTPIGISPHYVLPVALDENSLRQSGEFNFLRCFVNQSVSESEAKQLRLESLTFHLGARAIQLLKEGKVSEIEPDHIKPPIQIFFSHAKADLDHEHYDDPINKTINLINQLKIPVEQWFDSKNIVPSQKFEKAIDSGARDCTIMLAFQTDHYSSRPWCRREILGAKKYGAHLIVVDALTKGEVRSFPYSGNVPTVRWEYLSSPDLDARRVIDRAILEALKFSHNRAVLEGQKVDEDYILECSPEAITLVYHYDEEESFRTFLYPDPPLGKEELCVLKNLRPNAIFLTPLIRLAKEAKEKSKSNIKRIAISISDSDDIERYGLLKEHLETLFDEVCLYMFASGYQISYGGALSGIKTNTNFTHKLFDIAYTYYNLATDLESNAENVILNIVPWPLWLNYSDEWDIFSVNVAECFKVEAPQQLNAKIFPITDGGKYDLTVNSPEHRYAWSIALTKMRIENIKLIQARIIIGGKIDGFNGLVSGMLEEAYLSILNKQPVFIVGAFGGAAKIICDLLMQKDRAEITDAWAIEYVSFYNEACKLYLTDESKFISAQDMANTIKISSIKGLSGALNNGLSNEENELLIKETNINNIVNYILTGILRIESS